MTYPFLWRSVVLGITAFLLLVSTASSQQDGKKEELYLQMRAASASRRKAKFFDFIKSSRILEGRILINSKQKESLKKLEIEYSRQSRKNFQKKISTKFLSEIHADISSAKQTEKTLLEYYEKFRETILNDEQAEQFHREFLAFRMRNTPYLHELTDSLVVKELGLTQSQIDQIKKIADEELRQIQDKRVEVAREWYATLCNVLLDHQKKILDEQFGPPPKPMLTIFSLYLE